MEVILILNTEYIPFTITSETHSEINCACLRVLEIRVLVSVYIFDLFLFYIKCEISLQSDQIKLGNLQKQEPNWVSIVQGSISCDFFITHYLIFLARLPSLSTIM